VIVVSDTTAITSLLKIGKLELLSSLFGNVVIPRAVQAELLDYHSELPSWLIAKTAADRKMFRELLQQLDSGEAEAIILAKEIDADMLIIDEKRGRVAAEGIGLKCIGLAGILLLARHHGFISSSKKFFHGLKAKLTFILLQP
jgi:predicted nucleic acid-binding protein